MLLRLLFLYCLLLILSGCSGTKNLPANKTFVKNIELKLVNPKSVDNARKLKPELLDKAVPRLNSKFLGMFRIKLWMRTHVKEPKREKGLRHWLKYKVGEEPAYYDAEQINRATLVMEKHLSDRGYFRSEVEADTTMKKNKATVIYSVITEGRYYIRNVILPQDTDAVSKLIVKRAKKRSLLKPGRSFNMDVLKAQRDLFATLVRSRGYYDFNREYLYYYVDSTVGNRQVDIYFRLMQPSDSTQHTLYYIRDITVYPTFSIDDSSSALKQDTIVHQGVTIVQSELFLKKRTLVPNVLIRQYKPFSQRRHSYTINRFLDLGIFKFVNIKYEKSGKDSLDVIVQLTPANTQDVVGEVNLSTTTTNFLGTGASVSYVNRNLFRGGEMLSITGSMNLELQLNTEQSFINTMEVNARAEIGFPRFILLFNRNYKLNSYYIPRTKFGLSESYQRRVEYYTLNSVTADYSYDWRKNSKIRHVFTPVSVNSIRQFRTTSAFDQIVRENPTLRASFEDVFIITKMYSFIYNTALASLEKSYGYFRGNFEMAGDVIYAAAKRLSDEPGPYELLKRPFAQYVKTDFDARYYLRFSRKHSLAARLISGISVAHGNSEVTPYVKQFYIGGSTSVRAFRLRTLGPGGYVTPDDAQDVFPDQTGDIKLEMNLEYRFTIVKFLKAAVFADAGNVWLLREDTQRPLGDFKWNRFYKEIAIGTGAGLRLDFNFFVVRCDVSFPIRKPDLPEDSRWTFNNLQFGNRAWRKDNLLWNIAIGYPF